GEGPSVFDELEGQRTVGLEVRATLFLGNAPEVVRGGPIDTKIEREGPRIRTFGFQGRIDGRRGLLCADRRRHTNGDRRSDKAYCEPTTPASGHRHQRPPCRDRFSRPDPALKRR